MTKTPPPKKTAAELEAALLIDARFFCESATNPTAPFPQSHARAIYRIYTRMLEFFEDAPNEYAQSPFAQHWQDGLKQIHNGLLVRLLPHDANLTNRDWLKQFEPHLAPYLSGSSSIPTFLDGLYAQRTSRLKPEVARLWETATNPHVAAKGVCPSCTIVAKCGSKTSLDGGQLAKS